jgi:hypothetical protein
VTKKVLHCAGSLTRDYRVNSAGTELTVAAHVLGPYVLTATVAPQLAGTATVVMVSSGGIYSQRFELARLEMGSSGYDGVRSYAQAKRAQVVLAGLVQTPRPYWRCQLLHAPGVGSDARLKSRFAGVLQLAPSPFAHTS